MAEVGVFTPEVFPIAPPKTGPMEVAKRKVFDFIKSQAPSQHARRTMEKIDWVGDRLDGTSRELYEKLRPVAEKASQVAGVVTTTMEVVLALEVAVGAALLLGHPAGRAAIGELTRSSLEKMNPKTKRRILRTVARARRVPRSAMSSVGELGRRIFGKTAGKLEDKAVSGATEKAVSVAASIITGTGAAAVSRVGESLATRSTDEQNAARRKNQAELDRRASVLGKLPISFPDAMRKVPGQGDYHVCVLSDGEGRTLVAVRESRYPDGSRRVDYDVVDTKREIQMRIDVPIGKDGVTFTTAQRWNVTPIDELHRRAQEGIFRIPSETGGDVPVVEVDTLIKHIQDGVLVPHTSLTEKLAGKIA